MLRARFVRVLQGSTFLGLMAGLAFMLLPIAAQEGSHITTNDSDWWSVAAKYNLMDFSAPDANLQHRMPSLSNFEILTVSLSTEQFGAIATQLGQAQVVERGDAASGRSQVCYVSVDESPRVHLIFEQEREGSGFSFYLFEDGPQWDGDSSCLRSPRVSMNLQTASGLRLGESEPSVEAILGKPSKAFKNTLTYLYEIRKKTPPAELEKLRRRYPKFTEREFRDSFDFYFVDAYIEARFTSSGLNYLAVTKSQTYP